MLQTGGKTTCYKSSFGDKRLEERMDKIIEQISEKPSVSIPQAASNAHQAKAIYRFLDNTKVTPEKILEHHIQATLKAVSEEKVILSIQDTTELDYSSLKQTVGIGYLENSKLLGIKLHTALAVSAEGLPLGILWQLQWTRRMEEYGKKVARKKKETKDKESQRWIDCHNSINGAIDEKTMVIHVADRESDIYDYLSAPRSKNQHILLRFAQDRCVEGEPHRIKMALEAQQISGRYEVMVGRQASEPPRLAVLAVKYLSVQILSPAYQKKDKASKSITLTAIKAYEEDTNIEDPIEWNLLTTLPVESIDDVVKYTQYYAMRWLIERYHYTIKSGCQVEALQLETAERLENAVAVYCISAFRIMNITYLSRIHPEWDARAVFTEDEIYTLKLKFDKKQEMDIVTIKTAVIWIAQLGGFMARKSDGMPGMKTVWRGLLALDYLVEGALLARFSFAKLSKNNVNPS